MPPESLRALVREALRDALPEFVADLAAAGAPDADSRADDRWVSLHDDGDLARFVAQVVRLADDPREGPRLRSGELRFRLAGSPSPPSRADHAPPSDHGAPERRVEKGPVTERHVRDAEAAGVRRLVLGRAAVLTPMARDRARGAGVEIVRDTSRENGRQP